MKVGMRFFKKTTRACGHIEEHSFDIRNPGGRSEQEARLQNTICSSCRSAIMELAGGGFEGPCVTRESLEGRLPALLGTPGMVQFADSVRRRVAAHYFPRLEFVAVTAEQPFCGVRNALRLLFAVPSAKFWLDARADLLMPVWLADEVEFLLRPMQSLQKKPGPASAFGYWQKNRPEILVSARRTAHKPPAAA